MEQSIAGSALLLAQNIALQYRGLPQVEAVALAGSHTTQVAELGSDIDLYVYLNAEIPLHARKEIASQFATHVELNNQFWEQGDEWIDEKSGIYVDVMFRHVSWIEKQLEKVIRDHQASVGYSTCFWHNVLTSKSLFDRNGWFDALQKKATQPYPVALQRNVIAKNYPILRDNLSSYLHQIKHAQRRDDSISVNHRIAALLASYFDILFAINQLPHSGEKRLLQLAESQCQHKPKAMREQLTTLLTAERSANELIDNVHRLIDSLDELLEKQGLTSVIEQV